MCKETNHSYYCLSNAELEDLIFQRASWFLHEAYKKKHKGSFALNYIIRQLEKEFGGEFDFEIIMKDSEYFELVIKGE